MSLEIFTNERVLLINKMIINKINSRLTEIAGLLDLRLIIYFSFIVRYFYC